MTKKIKVVSIILFVCLIFVSCGKISLSEKTKSLMQYEEYTLTLKGSSAEKPVTWSTSNAKVATVDEKGLVHAIGVGSATITATVEDKAASCVVDVKEMKFPKVFEGAWMGDGEVFVIEDIIKVLSSGFNYLINAAKADVYEVYAYDENSFTLTWKFGYEGKTVVVSVEMKSVAEGSFDCKILAEFDGKSQSESEHLDFIRCPVIIYALYDDDVHGKKTVAQFEEFCKNNGLKDYSEEIKKADEFAKQHFDESLLDASMENSSMDVVSFLVEKGMDTSSMDVDYLFEYPESLVISVIKSDSYDVNSENKYGRTPLLSALSFDEEASEAVVKALLEKGADTTKGTLWGYGPVTYAIRYCSDEVAILLINATPDVNSPDSEGNYPLPVAVGKDEKASVEVVKLLLEKGADKNLGTIWGYDSVSYAKMYCSQEIVELLTK